MYPRPSPPIASLPIELLSHIFVLGTHDGPPPNAEDDDDGVRAFSTDSVKAPLIYGSVCRHWRRVALGTPALYTSLCITPELLRPTSNSDLEGEEEVLDTTPIARYLTLSRACPLDILIDARDPEWDFTDDGCVLFLPPLLACLIEPPRTYHPPFTPLHMHTVLRLLLPHLARWRALTVLTNLAAPMRAAHCVLEAALGAGAGAPRLEALKLLRCDMWAAGYPMEGARFLGSLPAAGDEDVPFGGARLPRLQTLRLVGVPTAWGALAALLSSASSPSDASFLPSTSSASPSSALDSAPSAGLRTLELSYLPAAAQPTAPELARLLRTAPALERLVLNGAVCARAEDAQSNHEDGVPISLPHLTALTLSLPSLPSSPTPAAAPTSAPSVLDLLNAPNVKTLVLEGAESLPLPLGGSPAEDEADEEVGALLARVLPTRHSDTPLFPALTHLTLRRASSGALRTLHTLLEARGAAASSCVRGEESKEGEAYDIGGVCVRVVRARYEDYPDDDDSSDVGEDAGAGDLYSDVESVSDSGDSEHLDADSDPAHPNAGDDEHDTLCALSRAMAEEMALSLVALEEREAAAFKPGGAFDDPVFDAAWRGRIRVGEDGEGEERREERGEVVLGIHAFAICKLCARRPMSVSNVGVRTVEVTGAFWTSAKTITSDPGNGGRAQEKQNATDDEPRLFDFSGET
ncbi:hypothetical protein FB451DRAFT_1522186 [Mycena latifolia]|nr:hypothetical protein FB451DRAFT_1522186 [Mycena latifolia]